MTTNQHLTFPCIQIEQPIGTFYVGSIPAPSLCDITYVDVRRIEGERGFETYLGIQRPLNRNRVKELQHYVQSADACFPTAVILAVPAECAEYDSTHKTMTLSPHVDADDPSLSVSFDQIAKVIDGQHRIEGLRESHSTTFEVNVSLFVDMDIADQAYLFSTVNLAQTKVNRSLVYDLYELAKTRSPQKTCHEIAVALDSTKDSPFYTRIKRLGVSTEGRFSETITQATFVQALLRFISDDPMADRNLYLTGKVPKKASADHLKKLIFRNMFIEKRDLEITDVVWNFFEAVRERWPEGWASMGRGLILNKTNGFKALMRFLRPCYLHVSAPGEVVEKDAFLEVLRKIDLSDQEFTTDTYKPGTSGESQLYRRLIERAGL
ncbi:MAG: DGQHR domain-containing protein [Deltaproteobacteria bacterium]|nr:DGQHR domain-containing protein [Deltaproteobacteria bacterium]